MASNKALKNKADKLWSSIIRWHGKCEWCKESGKRYEAAHIVRSRRFLKIRWELDNGLCLCSACHKKAHAHPRVFNAFVEKYIGGDIVNELKKRANRVDYQVNLQETVKTLENHLKSLE